MITGRDMPGNDFCILQSLAQRPGIVKSRDALMDAAEELVLRGLGVEGRNADR